MNLRRMDVWGYNKMATDRRLWRKLVLEARGHVGLCAEEEKRKRHIDVNINYVVKKHTILKKSQFRLIFTRINRGGISKIIKICSTLKS